MNKGHKVTQGGIRWQRCHYFSIINSVIIIGPLLVLVNISTYSDYKIVFTRAYTNEMQ